MGFNYCTILCELVSKKILFSQEKCTAERLILPFTLGVCFGEIALLGSGNMNRRTANVRAHGFTTLYVLFKVALLVNRYTLKFVIGQIGVTERKIGLPNYYPLF